MSARILFCWMLAWAMPATAMAQLPALEVSVQRADTGDGHVFEVEASGDVSAPPAAVWKILTDYERMPEFVPDLQAARVLSRAGNQVILEQFGSARFLFFRRDIHLVVQVLEQPMARIDIGLVSGDMTLYQCRWELIPTGSGGTRIVYSGKLKPKFYVPGMLGSTLVRSDIKRMMGAVLERLDRPAQAG